MVDYTKALANAFRDLADANADLKCSMEHLKDNLDRLRPVLPQIPCISHDDGVHSFIMVHRMPSRHAVHYEASIESYRVVAADWVPIWEFTIQVDCDSQLPGSDTIVILRRKPDSPQSLPNVAMLWRDQIWEPSGESSGLKCDMSEAWYMITAPFRAIWRRMTR